MLLFRGLWRAGIPGPGPPGAWRPGVWPSRLSSSEVGNMPTLFDGEGKVVRPDKGLDYFNAFGVQRSFALDHAELTRTYKRLQKLLHPDLFTLRPSEEQEVSSEWSALVNDAYAVLQKPLPRALYLLRLAGFPLDEETSCVVVPPDFLAEVMELNEELADAGATEIKILGGTVQKKLDDYIETIEVLFANDEFELARMQVAHMKYYANILDKIYEKETEFGMY